MSLVRLIKIITKTFKKIKKTKYCTVLSSCNFLKQLLTRKL